jgi:hypothetical protein
MTFLSVLLLSVRSAAPPVAAASRRLDHSDRRLARERRDARIRRAFWSASGMVSGLNQRDRARTMWCEGLGVSTAPERLPVRLDARDEQIPDIDHRALDAGADVDATLREQFPDLMPIAVKTVP